jgi:hypothetical protein
MERTDEKLYEKIKKKVYADIPKHSAYRSGILVQKYKEAFKNKYKNTRKKPYKGNRTKKKGLRRWFDEEWVNQRGEIGYKYKNDVYRPKIRITDDTPITHDELTKKEIKNARVKKYRKGRIDRFRKDKKEGGDRGVHQTPDPFPHMNAYEQDNVEFIDDDDDDDDDDVLNQGFYHELNQDFELFKQEYIAKVISCFNEKKIDIMNSQYTDLLEDKTQLELILQDILLNNEVVPPFCEGLPDYYFNYDENLIKNLDEEQKDNLLIDISQQLQNEILNLLTVLNLLTEEQFLQIDTNEELHPQILSIRDIPNNDDFVRIKCIFIIKQIIENTIKQFLYPDGDISVINNDISDSDISDSDISFDGGKLSKKYKKSISCNKPKGFSQKQHCKYGKNKTQKRKTKFKDYPDFRPNLTPRDMFVLGSFGGTYWRPIKSGVTGKSYKNEHVKYPKSWWKGIPEAHLTSDTCDVSINKYKVSVGTSLEFWESKNWINKLHPYGWVQWYCDFYQGKRGSDDERQIQRWKNLAGPRGRFMRFLVTQIVKKGAKWNDETVSPKIRQVLQHWGYKLTSADYNNEIKRRNV